MVVLTRQGFVTLGPSGGTFDSIDRYMTIKPDVWKVMNEWMLSEMAAIVELGRESLSLPGRRAALVVFPVGAERSGRQDACGNFNGKILLCGQLQDIILEGLP